MTTVKQPSPSEMKANLEYLRGMCGRSLKFLCRDVLNMPDWSDIHSELEQFLKTSGPYKLIELPRGHLKSSVVTKGWSIQQALLNPDIRILLANNTWDNSRKFLRSIQKWLEPGQILSQLFGNFVSMHWNQDECTIRMRKKVLDAPTWATTGLEKEQTSQHYDLIIADDLVARENVSTPEQREKVKLYIKDLYDLLEPQGRMVFIGTRWHQSDAYADLAEDPSFAKFIRTAYKNDDRTQVLFPQKFSVEKLNDLRAKKGNYEFSAQYLNNPIDPEAADFRQEQIKFYDPTTPHPASLYLTIDPAVSLSRDADFSALVVAGMYADRKIRVVDFVRRRMVPSDLVNSIFELVKKWRLHRVGIETFAFQKTLKYEIQRQQKEHGIFFSIDELGKRHAGRGEQVLSKEARIRRLQPYFEQGLLEIRSDMQDLQEELLAFPRGRHDDLIDALSYQLDYLFPSQAPLTLFEPTEVEWRPQTMRQVLQKTWNKEGAGILDRYFNDLKQRASEPLLS